jgi:hypothetical protein
MITRRSIFVLAVALACGLSPSPECLAQKKGGGGTTAPPVTYRILWLPVGTELRQMNNQGDLVGRFDVGVTSYWFLMRKGVMYDLNSLVNDPNWGTIAPWSLSDEVNGRLYVVGSGSYLGGPSRAFRLELNVSKGGPPGVVELRNLGTLPGDLVSSATDVNAAGQVVARSRTDANELWEVFFYSDTSGIVPIHSNFRHWSGELPRISESGFVAFDYKDLVTGERGILRWDALTGGSAKWVVPNWCTVGGINNTGNICGQNDFAGKGGKLTRAGYLLDGGAMRNLSPMHYATGLNNGSDVVGNSTFESYLYRSREAKVYTIDSLLDPSNVQSDLDLWFGTIPVVEQINDAGMIAGNTDLPDLTSQSFLLVPVSK